MRTWEGERAVIITALPVEYSAVRAHLLDVEEDTHTQGTVYERGVFLGTDTRWEVVLVETGPGNPGAAVETERAIARFNPTVVLFVGIAGALKDLEIGDVVVATKVYGYESAKADASLLPRPDLGESSHRLVQRARAEARKDDWLQRIRGVTPTHRPRVVTAPIAAGEKVVASTRSTVFRFLRRTYGDAVAVEMEGRGFTKAIHANQPLDALVVRGISDQVDGKTEADAAGSQDVASRHASAFAFQVLANLRNSQNRTLRDKIGTTTASGLSQADAVRVHFSELISYHCSVFAGRNREIATIAEAVSQPDGGYIFVEGPSGFGKTALLAHLVTVFPGVAYHFMNQGLAGTSQLYDPNTEEAFLSSMCAQFGERPGGDAHFGRRDLRALYISRLSEAPARPANKRILLIDAVDEVDPNHNFFLGLFPRSLPPNTFVVFSARSIGDRNYLHYVGLSAAQVKVVIVLDRFDLAGITALLRKGGGQAEQLAEDTAFVQTLLDITEGDPFYLRFLIDDISIGQIGRHNLRDTPRGLYDYLDSQFEILSRSTESRKQQRDILGYVLTAKGPLSRSDLISRVDGLDMVNFEIIVRGIQRFLREQNGQFTFCHERFKEYFVKKAQ